MNTIPELFVPQTTHSFTETINGYTVTMNFSDKRNEQAMTVVKALIIQAYTDKLFSK
ncbi:hypothetical protein FACS1894202_12550 [Clostridia bacterium]|nr:hypothetical protein FACS1894202_12550 [Clostridia bacterium]